MDPDRLAEIDQNVFSELDQAVGVQLVKVPVSAAVWSTWRRYCEMRGQSMGARVAGLIVTELETVVDGKRTTAAELADQIAEDVSERSGRLDGRERELRARLDRLRRREEQLTEWEQELRAREPAVTDARYGVKVGRNERCPCGSALKYKHCHGGPLRSET